MIQIRQLLLYGLTACLVCAAMGQLFAKDDEFKALIKEDDQAPEEVNDINQARLIQQNQINEQQFERWVFQNVQSAREGRKRLVSTMELQIEAVDELCGLSDLQRQKLDLAARGDIARFFDEFEIVREKFRSFKKENDDPNQFNQVWNRLWQDIGPLQRKLNAGLFSSDSLFRKVIRHTLNAEQLSKYEEDQLQRRQFQYHARLELLVDEMERGMPLTAEQRTKFLKILKDQTEPPLIFGQNDFRVMMLGAAKIPSETLKPIFDDVQWKALTAQFMVARQQERWLRQQKVIN